MEADPSQVPFELVRPILQAQAATAKVGWNPYLHDPKLPARLRRVTAPTLIVHARQDGIVPRAHAEAYASAIPDATVADLDARRPPGSPRAARRGGQARARTPRKLNRPRPTGLGP